MLLLFYKQNQHLNKIKTKQKILFNNLSDISRINIDRVSNREILLFLFVVFNKSFILPMIFKYFFSLFNNKLNFISP